MRQAGHPLNSWWHVDALLAHAYGFPEAARAALDRVEATESDASGMGRLVARSRAEWE